MNLYQHIKNLAISSICSRYIANLKILESDWSRTFWLISQKPDFFGLFPVTELHCRPNSEKMNDQIFEIIQKSLLLAYFGHIFHAFRAKKIMKKSGPVTHNLKWVSKQDSMI